jgi:hypothetical protein
MPCPFRLTRPLHPHTCRTSQSCAPTTGTSSCPTAPLPTSGWAFLCKLSAWAPPMPFDLESRHPSCRRLGPGTTWRRCRRRPCPSASSRWVLFPACRFLTIVLLELFGSPFMRASEVGGQAGGGRHVAASHVAASHVAASHSPCAVGATDVYRQLTSPHPLPCFRLFLPSSSGT